MRPLKHPKDALFSKIAPKQIYFWSYSNKGNCSEYQKPHIEDGHRLLAWRQKWRAVHKHLCVCACVLVCVCLCACVYTCMCLCVRSCMCHSPHTPLKVSSAACELRSSCHACNVWMRVCLRVRMRVRARGWACELLRAPAQLFESNTVRCKAGENEASLWRR